MACDLNGGSRPLQSVILLILVADRSLLDTVNIFSVYVVGTCRKEGYMLDNSCHAIKVRRSKGISVAMPGQMYM